MKNQSYKILNYAVLFLIIAIVIGIHPGGGIHTEQTKSIKIGKWFSNSQVIFPFIKAKKNYRLAISGSIQLHKDHSLIRVILVGDDFHEYLVYEAYPLIVDYNSLNIINECEETCIIDGISPHSLKIELIDASLKIDEMSLTNYPPDLQMEPAETQKQIKEERDADKINKINVNINKKGLKWIAGETSVSQLFYEEKRKLFGREKVPNLQGFDYYKGGIYEIISGDNEASLPTIGDSSLIESFDWRNRHGANNPDSPYYDGDPTGSGWITSVKNQGGCGSCWAFGAVGPTEAVVNLYFNQHLDLDLSEQDVLSCSGEGSCSGGYSFGAMTFIRDTGVVDEACFPYSASDESCGNKCSSPDNIIKIEGARYLSFDEEVVKWTLIKNGPLTFDIWGLYPSFPNHCVTLVGYTIDLDDGRSVWIFKNSWGTTWGENGYGRIKGGPFNFFPYAIDSPILSLNNNFEIACLDKDGDGYYNWGISTDKPSSCPENSHAGKDCDDSDPDLGSCPLPGCEDYTFDDTVPFNFEDISATGTDFGLDYDNTYAHIAIPFTFSFYGRNYDAISVSVKGTLYFVDAGRGWSDECIPAPDFEHINTFVAPFWDNFYLSEGGAMLYDVKGNAPNRRLIVQWHQVSRFFSVNGTVTFQVVLYEGSNQILFQYDDIDVGDPDHNNGASATVGLQRNSICGTQYSCNTASLTDGLAILFTPAEPPVVEIVNVSTEKDYSLAVAKTGTPPYIDRNFTITEISSGLDKGILVQTANEDKMVNAPAHLELRLNEDAVAFACYDKRGVDLDHNPPPCIGEWRYCNESISTDDIPASPLVVFMKNVTAGEEIIIGGNHYGGDTGALSNYFVVVKTKTCKGDFDWDHDVDGSDLPTFAADFGRTDCLSPPLCEGDFDGDNDVDESDFVVFAADFGRTDCP